MNHKNSAKHPDPRVRTDQPPNEYTTKKKSPDERPLPRKLRQDVERATGDELPEDCTYEEAIRLIRVRKALLDLEATREARMAARGRETQRIEIAEATQETKEDIKKGLWTWFGEMEYERCKLFNMPVPEDTIEMAKKKGVPLELPPCQQEQGQNTKDARNNQEKSKASADGEGERNKSSPNGNDLKN